MFPDGAAPAGEKAMTKVSPLAPERFPDLPIVRGVRLAAGTCGLGYKGRNDLMLAELAPGTAVAGVLTRSLTASAPVEWVRKALRGGSARALVVNSGNANAFTGGAGAKAVERTVEAAADLFPCRPSTVFLASTGVIGEPISGQQIVVALPALKGALRENAWEEAAAAIMTTDTYPKGATRTALIGGVEVTINGIAKGSGMIGPDMATMLAFVFTDAAIPADVRPAVGLRVLEGGAALHDAVRPCRRILHAVVQYAVGRVRYRVAPLAHVARHVHDAVPRPVALVACDVRRRR